VTPAATPRLFADRESAAAIRSCLDRNGFDLAHEMLRPDYLVSPFPNREWLLPRLGRLDPALLLLIQLFTLGESMSPKTVGELLGSDLLEAGLATGLLALDESGTRLSTAGLQIVSRLGQYFVVSTSRGYPGFDPAYADIYLGPESYTLANYLQRRAGSLPSAGRALDLCSGSGIAGQSLAAIRRGMVWTGVDLAPLAVEAATFDAMLNEVSDRYTPVIGDLYEPVAGQYFQLIVANPPFIPVPASIDFPVYGDGGEDGLSVLTPMLETLKNHLAPSGRAIIYAEGLGNERGPFVLDLLERIAACGLTIGVTLLSTMTTEQTLFSIGRMLAAQSPPRIEQLAEWQALFERFGATRYDKFVIEARLGDPAVVVRSLDSTPIARPGARS
jgi:hypothetical protein